MADLVSCWTNLLSFYTRADNSLWKKSPIDINTKPELLIGSKDFSSRYTWTHSEKGIYFRKTVGKHQQISFYDFSTRQTTPIVRLPWKSSESYGALSLIEEDGQLIFTVGASPQANLKKLTHPFLD